MKKILAATMATVIMSVSAFGAVGTITKIRYKAGESAAVTLTAADGTVSVQRLVGTAEDQKAMLAVLLTAKTSNATITLSAGTIDGLSGWTAVSY